MSQPTAPSSRIRLPERAVQKLQELRSRRAEWSVEELADEVNQLVPWYLPDADAERSNAKVSAEFTVRSLRHYQNEGVIDPPEREGKEARYGYRHLLQALLVRRLLWEGHGRSTITALLTGKSERDYERLLEGGVQITATPANPALSYLEKLRHRSSDTALREAAPSPRRSPPLSRASSPPAAPTGPRRKSSSVPRTWLRHEITEGLELHVSSDFRPPVSPKERQNLAEQIQISLEGLQQP